MVTCIFVVTVVMVLAMIPSIPDVQVMLKRLEIPLAIQSDKMDYQTKKAREGDPIGPYLSHLTR
jgi:hypothetical protein